MFLRLPCILQDASKTASHDLGETQSRQLQDPDALTSSLTVIYRQEEIQCQEESGVELPREEIERKTVTLLEEYFGIEDLKVMSHGFSLTCVHNNNFMLNGIYILFVFFLLLRFGFELVNFE